MILRKDKGFVMVMALVILLALTVMGITMISTSIIESKISGVEKEEAQALYLSEAGIAMIRGFIQNSAGFTPVASGYGTGITLPAAAGYFVDCAELSDVTGITNPYTQCPIYASPLTTDNEQDFFRRRLATGGIKEYNMTGSRGRSQFADTNGDTTQDAFNPKDDNGSDTPALRIENQAYLNALFTDFSPIGRIVSIEVYPPVRSFSNKPYPICTVRVTAETITGYRKTVEAEIMESEFVPITAGAQAGTSAAWNGAGTINWGPIKAKGDVGLNYNALNKQCDGADPGADPWFKAMINGVVSATSGSPTANNCTDCIGCSGINNGVDYRPWDDLAVYQNQDVELDTWDKDKMKDYALSYGYYYVIDPVDSKRVYSTNADGNPIGDPIAIQGLLNDAGRDPFIYIDAGGPAKTVELQVAGQFYSKGDIFIDGSFKFSGSGSGSDIPVKDPSGATQTLNDINFNGVLYMTGELQGTGSPKIFGGVVAELGLQSGGNPQIWYDYALMEGGRQGVPVSRKGTWREIVQ